MNGFPNPTKPTCKSNEFPHLHLTEFLFETYSAEHSQDDKFVGFADTFCKVFFPLLYLRFGVICIIFSFL